MSALREARPLLTDAAALAARHPPGRAAAARARRDELDRALDEGMPVLRRAVALAARLEDTLAAVAELSEDPATVGHARAAARACSRRRSRRSSSSRRCRCSCNYLGLWTRNVPNTISEGDAVGHLVPHARRRGQDGRGALVGRARARPAHEPLPAHAAQNGECEAGNEPWLPGQQIGNVPGRPGRRDRADAPAAGGGRREAPRNPNGPPRSRTSPSACSFIVLDVLRVLARLRGRAVAGRVGAAGGRPPGDRARAALAGADRRRRGGQGRRRSSAGEGDTAIVTLALEDDALPIHEDATLKVRPRIFLEGNFFVDLKPGTPAARRRSTRATRSRSRRPPRRCSSTRSCRRSRRTRAATSSCSLHGLGEGFADGGAQSLERARGEPSDAGVHAGRDRRRGVPRRRATTTCPSFVDARRQTRPRAASRAPAAAPT